MVETFEDIRRSVRAVCADFPGAYWRELDIDRSYPQAFVQALDRARSYARERVVFGRPIGQNQGIALPIARSYAQTEAAALELPRSY